MLDGKGLKSKMRAYLCVYDLQFPWAGLRLICSANKSDERGAEEHLHDSACAVI